MSDPTSEAGNRFHVVVDANYLRVQLLRFVLSHAVLNICPLILSHMHLSIYHAGLLFCSILLFLKMQPVKLRKAQYTPPTRRNCRVELCRRCVLGIRIAASSASGHIGRRSGGISFDVIKNS